VARIQPVIRPATALDLASVRDLLVATWHATYDAIYGPDEVTRITDDWHSLENLAKGLTKPAHLFLVAADQSGSIVATASATDRGEGLVWLDRLYVLPAAQGRGIGTALLHSVQAGFPDANRCGLEVESRNAQGVGFYRRAGFEGDEQGFCHHQAKAIRLEKRWPADS
jgi:ribosomal protein S18 acetylase RimI-like enzyme